MALASHTVPLHACTRAGYRVLMFAAFLAEVDATGRARIEIVRPFFARTLVCSPGAVGQAVQELVRAGLLAPVERPVLIGARRSTVYAVLPGGEPYGATS